MDQVQSLYQRARTSSDAELVKRVIKDTRISAKQRKSLVEVLGGLLEQRYPSRTLKPARSAVAGEQRSTPAYLSQQERTLRGLHVHPKYREMWAHMGAHRTIRPPQPIFAGMTARHKYVHVTAHSTAATFTVAAGTTTVFLCDPARRDTPVWSVTGAGTPEVVDAGTFLRDTLVSGANLHGQWVFMSPHELLADAAAVKSGNYVKLPSANLNVPLLTQVQFSRLRARVAVPFDGQAVVYAMSEGSAPRAIGRGMERITFDQAPNFPSVAGLDPAFHGNAYGAHIGSASTSFQQAVQRYGETVLMNGSSNSADLCFEVQGAPDDTFMFEGQLDTIDAPDSGYVSIQNNLRPRSNPWYCLRWGAICVVNPSSVPCTVVIDAKVSMAVVIPPDDGTRQIPALVSTMRMQAATLRFNPPASDQHLDAPRVGIGRSFQEIEDNRARAVGVQAIQQGEPQREPPQVQHGAEKNPTPTGAERRIASSNWWSGLGESVSGIAREIGEAARAVRGAYEVGKEIYDVAALAMA